MYAFMTGFTSPESVFVDFKYIIPVFATIFEKRKTKMDSGGLKSVRTPYIVLILPNVKSGGFGK